MSIRTCTHECSQTILSNWIHVCITLDHHIYLIKVTFLTGRPECGLQGHFNFCLQRHSFSIIVTIYSHMLKSQFSSQVVLSLHQNDHLSLVYIIAVESPKAVAFTSVLLCSNNTIHYSVYSNMSTWVQCYYPGSISSKHWGRFFRPPPPPFSTPKMSPMHFLPQLVS